MFGYGDDDDDDDNNDDDVDDDNNLLLLHVLNTCKMLTRTSQSIKAIYSLIVLTIVGPD